MFKNENDKKGTPKFNYNLNESFIDYSNFSLGEDNNNNLELNRSLSVDFIDTSHKIIYINLVLEKNNNEKKIKQTNKSEKRKKNILLSPINNLYKKQFECVTSFSKINNEFLTLNAKFDYIYKLYFNKNLKNNWKNQFELICQKINLDLEEITYNLNFKTNCQIQSYLYTIEKFWILLIQYEGTIKNFSFKKLIYILKISNNYVKSLYTIIDLIFMIPNSVINKITKTEMIKFCQEEFIPLSKKNKLYMTKKEIIKKIFTSNNSSKHSFKLNYFSYICPKYYSSINNSKNKNDENLYSNQNNKLNSIEIETKQKLNKLIKGIIIDKEYNESDKENFNIKSNSNIYNK